MQVLMRGVGVGEAEVFFQQDSQLPWHVGQELPLCEAQCVFLGWRATWDPWSLLQLRDPRGLAPGQRLLWAVAPPASRTGTPSPSVGSLQADHGSEKMEIPLGAEPWAPPCISAFPRASVAVLARCGSRSCFLQFAFN